MLPKEKEFIDKYRLVIDSKINDEFLSSSLSNGLRTPVPQFICLKHNLPFLTAAIELHKHTKGLTSPPVLEAMINYALSDRENKQNLSEDDFWSLATIPLSSKKYKPMQVHKTALEQLRSICLIKDKDVQKKAALVIYKTILDTYSTVSIQQQLLKHWTRMGSGHEVAHLLPALSTSTSPITVTKQEIFLFELDCNKFAVGLSKISEQKQVLDHASEVFRVFKKYDDNSAAIIMETENKLLNKILVYFNSDAKINILTELMEFCLSDIKNVVKNPPRDTYYLADNNYKQIALKVELEGNLPNKPPTRKTKI